MDFRRHTAAILVLFVAFSLAGCAVDPLETAHEHNDRAERCEEAVAYLMSRDQDFIHFSQRSVSFIEEIEKKIRQQGLGYQDYSCLAYEELPVLFKLNPEGMMNDPGLRKIIENHELISFEEGAVSRIISHATNLMNREYRVQSGQKSSCQENFEEAFHKANKDYKAAIVSCGIVALMNPGGGAVCAMGATGKVIYEMAVAIDEYNACMEGQ